MDVKFDKKLKINKEGAFAMSQDPEEEPSESTVKVEGETKKSIKTVQSNFMTEN